MTGKGKPAPFALVYDGGIDNPQKCWFDNGDWCACEDTSWYRIWRGSLDGKYEVEAPMCGQGGASIYTEAQGNIALTLFAPSGVGYVAHDIDGRIEKKMRAVIMPRSVGPDPTGPDIERGIWRIVVEGVERRAQLSVTIQMNYPEMQTAMAVEADWQKANWPAWPHSGLSY